MENKQQEAKGASLTPASLDTVSIFADVLIIAADAPASGNQTGKPGGHWTIGWMWATRRPPQQLREVRPLVPVPFFWMFFYCLPPYMFFPFCSLVTCIGWAGLCLYSWIHPFQALFLDLRITECHNSRKSGKHCFLQGEINFFESHKDCMAVVFFHLIIIQHQGHLNQFDFSSACQSTLSFCWFNKVSSPSQPCFQIMETVQTEHGLLNLNQKCHEINLKNNLRKISYLHYKICTNSVQTHWKPREGNTNAQSRIFL